MTDNESTLILILTRFPVHAFAVTYAITGAMVWGIVTLFGGGTC